jgi:hypothetical protein
MIAEDLRLFRHGVLVGLAQLRRTPGSKTPPALPIAADRGLARPVADEVAALTAAVAPTSSASR